MGARRRLDAELVRRGLARSREQAAELIAAGRVRWRAQAAGKPATQVGRTPPITVRAAERGAGLRVPRRPQAGRRAGRLPGAARSPAAAAWTRARPPAASPTCCCAPGPAHVVAVDVGYGQLAWALRTDPRVTVLDRVNVREPAARAGGPGARPGDRRPVVHLADAWCCPRWSACAAPDADFVLLVKPQFEVGKGRVGAGGVVRDPAAAGRGAVAVGGRGRRRAAGSAWPG